MDHKVLITGGSGLIGSHLSTTLAAKGYQVAHLSRKKSGNEKVQTFEWDIDKMTLEKGALDEVKTIVHLAGASVAGKTWTERRKKVIRDSRTKSAELLFQTVKEQPNQVQNFISASGISIYGNDRGQEILPEEATYGSEFLAEVCKDWEAIALKFEDIGVRSVQVRTGLVLSIEEGLLPKMLKPVKFGVGAPLGNGKQLMSWIHVDDLVDIYIKAIEDEKLKGPYNAVAPNPVSNREFTRQLADITNRPLIAPNVPGIFLKLGLGEMAEMIVGGLNVTPRKIQNSGFQFKYKDLEFALRDLLHH